MTDDLVVFLRARLDKAERPAGPLQHYVGILASLGTADAPSRAMYALRV